jgi:hypothetical protein
VFVVLAFIAVQVLFLALLFLVFALLSRQRVEVTNWDEAVLPGGGVVPDPDDVFDPAHQECWGYYLHDDSRT